MVRNGKDSDRFVRKRPAAEFDAFVSLVEQKTAAASWPMAKDVKSNIPIYQWVTLSSTVRAYLQRVQLMEEWCSCLKEGPGVFIIRGAITNHDIIDRATEIFMGLIEIQREEGAGAGDHFAAAGANDRLWNALQKHCKADPVNFLRYYASDVIALASEAWLGPGYQMTAQVNLVHPGGKAQNPHRDYHLGFMDAQRMAQYPCHIHRLSPLLTLQGAIAHCDMPVESGPTLYLPYSQLFEDGYLTSEDKPYWDYFKDHHTQLALMKGDAVFFNPALMHAAGSNITNDVERMANLLQVSSPFGRAMEMVDRTKMCRTLYPYLKHLKSENQLSAGEIRNTIAACAEGYAFPTNLDRDPPIDGMAPNTQNQLMLDAVEAGISIDAFESQLDAWETRRGR